MPPLIASVQQQLVQVQQLFLLALARELWRLGHVPPSTSSNLIFYASLRSYYSMKAISHVKCVPRFLFAYPVIKISLFFILFKNERVYRILLQHSVAIFCYFTHVTLYRCRFVPLLAPNPGNATVYLQAELLSRVL